MTTNPKLDFCRSFVQLNRRPITFDGRNYLEEIYASQARNLVIRASRQVEKSTFLANTLIYELIQRPGVAVLLVCPRWEQARVFVRTRLLTVIQHSPLVRRVLLGQTKRPPQISNMEFANGSLLHVRAAYHSGDAVRGVSSDFLLVDEIQDIAAGDLPVLQETLSHSKIGRTIMTGTPKLVENHLEAAFARSTANEWSTPCPRCAADVIPDERCLGRHGIACPHCQQPLDVSTGRWVPRNPDSQWGHGYWLNHTLVPWLNYDEILDRQAVYDLAKFKNEVLGLSTTLGEHVVTRAELEACCTDRHMIQSFSDIPAVARKQVIVGIDWGGGGRSRTVVVVGWMRPDFVFEVGAFFRFRADEDTSNLLASVAEVCQKFRVQSIAADGGGNGHFFNRLLLERLDHHYGMYGILYSTVDQEPRQEGQLWKWTVNRSATIGTVFARVKKRSISFPKASECGSYVDEFACEVATYDDANRTIKYTHPETMQDDALHATNYAVLLATRSFNMNSSYAME